MKTACGVVRDLLPLYAEKLTGEESNALVREHVAECKDCAEYLDKLQLPVDSDSVAAAPNENSLKLVCKDIRSRKVTAVLFSALLVFVVMLSVFARMIKPDYVSYKDSGIVVTEAENGDVYAQFSDNVTSCKVVRTMNEENGTTEVEIEAWTCAWDKILGKTATSALISSNAEKTAVAYYCDCTNTLDNATVIYGTGPYDHITFLPRIVLGYYFVFALAAAVLIGLVWFILRKKEKASKICRYLFAAPLSYMLAHLALATGFTTFSVASDFILNCVAAAAIYGTLIFGAALLKQHKQDKAAQ